MKNFIDKILDVPKLIRRIWLMLWVILVILLVLKFCFNQWYPVVSRNETFNSVCKFIDDNKIYYNIISYILYIINFYIVILTTTGNKIIKKWYFNLSLVIIALILSLIKQQSNLLGLLCEMIFVIVLPIIINIKTCRFKNNIINILLPIIFYIIVNLWQFTILIIRNTDDFVITNLPSLVLLILQIDYYIFITITWIGVSFMGFAGIGWFWSKSSTELKAMREIELAKKNPNEKLIAKIDERITKLEKEGK